MLGPAFWSQVHASEHERGNQPCSTPQKRRVTSPAADGVPWNDPLPPQPGSPPALSPPLAFRIRCLKENRPCDKKLRALKKMILAQRRKCIPRLPERSSPSLPMGGGSRGTKPLKRKVCKAGAFSAPTCPGHSERTGKKLRTGRNSASSSWKAEKERAVTLFGVSAWREGQKLARHILGPPLNYPSFKTELKSKGKEPFQESRGDPFTGSQSEQNLRENGQDPQPEMKKTKRERRAAQLNRKWQDWKDPGWTQKWTRSHQKAPDTEKKNENHPTSAGGARKAGSTKGSSDGLKATPSPKTQNASAKVRGTRGTSRPGEGRLSGPPLGRETPRKERQPTTTLAEARQKPYSPEQLREFMDLKAAERNRRAQEERRTSKQAQEERNQKLQEVFRKQRQAAVRRSRCAEQPRDEPTSITPTKNNIDLKYPGGQLPARGDPKGVCRASRALLRKESKPNSMLEPRMDETGQVTPRLGCTSMDPEGQLRSPLKLKQVDISSWPSHRSPGPFHLWREKVIGMETRFSSDISTSPPYRSKQDRVKAIHNLAKDLNERLGREIGRLQTTRASRDQECRPGTPPKRSQMTTAPGVPLEKFDAPENAESVWGSRPSLNPPMCPQERACLEKDLDIPMVKESISQHLLPTDRDGLEVIQMDSAERRQSRSEAKDLKEVKNSCRSPQSLASEMGSGEKGPTGPPASVFTGSGSILVEIPKASLKKNQPEGSDCQKKPPENPPGQGGLPFTAQHQPDGFPFPSINLPPGKASAAEDLSEPTDSKSQWSEIGQFYGGAASFGRLSLTLVEQSLREEELRARHQSALLRLREKALQEKAQAELAWLEHGQRSPNGLQGPSSTAEKQLSILTRLKQEQAEIRHLQNIGRAAHQERKLLLQQQKELLEVQKATTRLWLQVAGQLPHQISEDDNHPPGVGMLEEEKFEASFQIYSGGAERRSSPEAAQKLVLSLVGFYPWLLVLPPRPTKTMKFSWRLNEEQLQELDRHLAESKDVLPPQDRVAEGFAKWKPGRGDPSKVLEATIQDLHDPSAQRPQDPALGDGRTTDHLASRGAKEHDNGLTKNSQEGHRGSPLDKDPEGFASAGSSSIVRGFCPYPEKSPPGLEFHKGYAVLVNLSGSSPSPSDLEDDGLQDTDVSLPEEFILQEPLPDHLGLSTHHEAPAVPRIVINTEDTLSSSEEKPPGQISGGDPESKDLKCAQYSQEKIWEDTPGTERLVESGSVVSSSSGRLQGTPSPLTKKDHVHTPTLRSRATSLNVSEEISCAENSGNETTSQSPVDPGMVFSSTNHPFQCPQAEGKKDPGPSFNATGEGVEDENPSPFGNKEATGTLAPDASPNIGAHQDSEDPLRGPKDSSCHRFPNASDHLLVSEDKTRCANRSTDECVSHKPDEISLQLNKTSPGNRDLAEEHRKSSSTKNQNKSEAGMPTVHSSSPQEGLLENEGDAVGFSDQLLSELEDDVMSLVDEMLTYGSSDLPSSTEKEVSSGSPDLPAPPENPSGNEDEANSSLLGFPSPPDPVASSEAEELSSLRDLPVGGGGSPPRASTDFPPFSQTQILV